MFITWQEATYHIQAGDDAAEVEWVDFDRALELPLAYDHSQVLHDIKKVYGHKFNTTNHRVIGAGC